MRSLDTLDVVSSLRMILILFGFEDTHLEFAIIPVFSTPKYCLHCLSVGGKRLHASLSSWNTVWGRTHRPHYYSSLFPLRQNGLVVRRSQVNWLVWNLYPASLQPYDLGQLALSSLSVIFLFWNLRIKMILQCLWLELI